MPSWFNAISSGWVKDDGYHKLDAAANTVCAQVNTNWHGSKVVNGVDH
jgi:hypothetical protein